METKERNTGKEKSMEQEELLNEREALSDEALKEIAGGGEQFDDSPPPRCDCSNPPEYCYDACFKSREDCPRGF